MSSQQPSRLSSYKHMDKSADSLRQARTEGEVRLRKDKRVQQLMKKRNVHAELDDSDEDETSEEEVQIFLSQIIPALHVEDSEKLLLNTVRLRKLLSRENDPPIQAVVDSGVIPRLCQFLQLDSFPQLQFEAAWALTNIASGNSEQTAAVVREGTIPLFVRLVYSPNLELVEQCIWAVGNIVGDDFRYRDAVIELGLMPRLLEILTQQEKLSLLRNATWAVSNMCRGKDPPADFSVVSTSLPVLAQLLYNKDTEIIQDALWALSYLSDGPNEHIQAVINAGIARRVVELLLHTKYSVIIPALRTAGNIVTGDDVQTEVMLNCGLIPMLFNLLKCNKETIRKEACWAVSNICAGTKAQIQAVIEYRIFPDIIRLLQTGDAKTKKEALWVITNATSGGAESQIRHIASHGAIPALCAMLSYEDVRLRKIALDSLDNILAVGKKDAEANGTDNEYALQVEDCGGLDRIEELQAHQNEDIYNKSFRIVDTYFGGDDEDIDDLAPTQNPDGQQFQFGGSAMGGGSNQFNF